MPAPDRIAKELSWLAFNERVLQEAADPRNPVIERVRFLGVFSSNQDEFFKVRVAEVRRKSMAEGSGREDSELRRLLSKIQQKIVSLSRQFDQIYQQVMTDLANKKIFFISSDDELSDKQRRWLEQHFRDKILRHIVPIWVSEDIHLDEHLEAEVTYLVVQIQRGSDQQHAIIDVPDRIPRFINVPPDRGHARNYFMLADEVIRHCLDQIFRPFVDYDSLRAWSMKFSRDSEYELDDDLDMSIIEKLTEGVKSRKTADPMRLSYDKNMPAELVSMLCAKLGIQDLDSVIAGGRYRNFRDFIEFRNPGRRQLQFAPMPALACAGFERARNLFAALDAGDQLLYYPYHRFSYFTEFVRQAAADPQVRDIRVNIYRVAARSRVIESLIDAARNGKKVTANIELRARFDEQHNLELTEKLADSNVKVTLGIPGLKVHSKLCVITRMTDGGPKRYAVIATGNFNEKTAKIYTDFALFTAHPELCAEAESVFRFIEKSYRQPRLQHLWVSPLNTRSKLTAAIEREIDIAQAGGEGRLSAKLNNLVDDQLTDLLYRASRAGVQIRLLVRGMCEASSRLKNISKNIRITSIVDRFLEHSRILVFHNAGDPQVYISSADWMTRNLDRRVEVTCPIYDAALKRQLLDILELQFADNQKARIVDAQQQNHYVPRGNRRKLRSQEAIYELLRTRQKP
ncbi:MAG: polyphosphate kinase 1 [Cellvibrionales bacterium]|nr:polyphosphate kinase 1 [Cellvibrionales bacterium]